MYVCDTKSEFAEWLNETVDRLEEWRAEGLRSLESYGEAYREAQASALFLGLVDILDALPWLPGASCVPDGMRDKAADIIIARLARAADWFDPEPPARLKGRSLEIWNAVATANRRLMPKELYERGILENSNTRACLASLKRTGDLTQRDDTDPPGLGLPHWD